MDFEALWKELLENDEDYSEDCSTVEEVVECLKDNYGEGGEHGYGIFQSDHTDALHIERIDELDWYDDDVEAAKQAEKDGIKIIHDIRIPEDSNLHYYEDTFIDTPENREVLIKEIAGERRWR